MDECCYKKDTVESEGIWGKLKLEMGIWESEAY